MWRVCRLVPGNARIDVVRLAAYLLVVLLIVGIVVQVFFRYQYYAVGGRSEVVFRADRFTGSVCVAFPNRECPAPWEFWR
jgi:hypothetical protein